MQNWLSERSKDSLDSPDSPDSLDEGPGQDKLRQRFYLNRIAIASEKKKISPSGRIAILKEFCIIRDDPIYSHFLITYPTKDDISTWIVSIFGPDGTCYEGGLFNLRITFYDDYPMSPPIVAFDTKIYHPCVSLDGSVSLGLIINWTPVVCVSQILLTVQAMLYDPLMEDPLRSKLLEQYNSDREAYMSIAREWTLLYATE